MKRLLLIAAVLSLTGCAVYTTPYPHYPAAGAVIYQDPWPVRVPVAPQVVVPVQPSVIYEDHRQYYYHPQNPHQHTYPPKKKPSG